MFRRLDWVENRVGKVEWAGEREEGLKIFPERERGQRGIQCPQRVGGRAVGRGASQGPMEEKWKQWR